jgi:predicted phage-related endonuclease
VTFTIVTADQRTQEWRQARCGRVTGSRAKDVLASIKSGEAAARRDYRTQLVTERLTGQPQDSDFVNADMLRGIEMEGDAFRAYEAHSGNLVRRTGFLAVNEHLIGCSLDGDVDQFTGIVELKVPRSATHVRYLRDGGVPAEHVPQIVHNLLVTGAQWCDFASFDPRFPEALRLFVVRLHRDDAQIEAYLKKLSAFLEEVEAEYQAMLTLANPSAQMEAALGV